MVALRGNTGKVKKLAIERRTRIVELYRSGKDQKQIADELGITQGRISQLLAQCKADWERRNDQAIGEKIAMEVDELNRVRSAAWEAYVKSQQDAVTISTKKAPPRKSDDEDEEPVDLRRRVKKANDQLRIILQEEKRVGQCGDPAFLHIVKDCTLQILKLLGAFPKDDTTNNVVIQQFDFSQFTEPIPCPSPIRSTPSDEVEARIAAESSSSAPTNTNGNGHV